MNAQAAAVVTLLQRALQDSIEADRHYRDGFLAVTNARCPVPHNQDFRFQRALPDIPTSRSEAKPEQLGRGDVGVSSGDGLRPRLGGSR